jgi:hypothetical protein
MGQDFPAGIVKRRVYLCINFVSCDAACVLPSGGLKRALDRFAYGINSLNREVGK